MAQIGYSGGELKCEEIPLADVARRFGTPTFVYSRRAFEEAFDRINTAFSALHAEICFSIKSCHNLHILRLLREREAAFDAVSIGEVRRALEAGAEPGRIVFAGVGKSEAELEAAIEIGVGWFNAESVSELELLSRLAGTVGRNVNAALRVNPDVDPRTHPYTTTGRNENKFGVEIERAYELFRRFAQDPWLRLHGVHLHIGSPVNSVQPYVEAIGKALDLVDRLRRDGLEVRLVNIGGGYGADYGVEKAPAPEDYAKAIVPLLAGRDLTVHLEPGRSISANAGVLLARVVCVKESRTRRFVIVDAAMTDLIRPALYGSYHFIWPVVAAPQFEPPHFGTDLNLPGTVRVDVVGPVCESGDFLGKDRYLPPVERGELLAVFSAGAYGAVMSSQYNTRPRAAEVLIENGTFRLIRRRETYDDLVAAEREV